MTSRTLFRPALLLAIAISRREISADALVFRSDSVDIDMVTQPLHREIESLKEELGKLEGSRDTLEAAAEQFRVQAKTLKVKLMEEMSRYDSLMAAMSGEQEIYEAEIERLSRENHEYEERLTSAETSLNSELASRLETESRHRYELTRMSQEYEAAEQQWRSIVGENELLQSMVKRRNLELSEANTTHHLLHQQLHIANEKLDNLEKESKLTIWSVYWSRVQNSDTVSAALSALQEHIVWYRHEVALFWDQNGTMNETVTKYIVVAWDGLMERVALMPEVAAQKQLEVFNYITRADMLEACSSIWNDVIASCQQLYQKCVTASLPPLDSLKALSLGDAMEGINYIHSGLVVGLEWSAGAAIRVNEAMGIFHNLLIVLLEWSAGVIAGLNEATGNSSQFVETACSVLHTHSGNAAISVEIMLLLLTYYVGSTLLNRRSQPCGTNPVNGRFMEAPPALKQSPQNPSLLRTATGFSRRPQ